MKKKYIAIGLSVVVVWVGAMGFLAAKSKSKKVKEDQAIKRYVIPQEKKTFFSGVVEPSKSKTFSKDLAKGDNYEINKKNGEFVSKGSVLITYKNEEISDQISDLEDQISDLKKGKNKSDNSQNNENQGQNNELPNNNLQNSELPNKEASTNMNLNASIDDQIKSIQKQIEKLKKKEYTYEYAPFAGEVSIPNKGTDEPNKVLLKLKSNDLYVNAQVSERDLEKIKLNQEVEVLVLANDKTIKGEIVDISNDPEENAAPVEGMNTTSQVANYPVRINLESKENVVNGYHVQIKAKPLEEAIEIPKTAIKTEGSKKYVYLIKDKKLVKQNVRTKGEKGDSIIVTSGLKEKEEIVEVINSDMKEGQEIE
ncbi:HlyD family efflux transporter periplasmic adaptor subunit [Paraclostridium ghonii]|uniref:efflux RND transporter periplasmic adaptor subunit n=1 Tax=Paraclostridium ghonii TaxID=29358 RepID=UPI00202D05FE|nr:HlyD family efflux transporter periplasmic adaptor subunit [Paeniclostridium ghonii]MCM0165210.1 efflux RND transporter periplasmic adaptor subunit [Paeniclostridium ghonii]